MAVFWAAFFNFVAAFLFGTAVAKTIGADLIDITVVNSDVVLGGLLGAIAWNLITWYFGIPSSSSHALIGGYAGAAVARVGIRAIVPGHGLGEDALLHRALAADRHDGRVGADGRVSWIFHKSPYGSVDRWFRRAQLGSAAAFSLSHGTNDAQKTMGIIGGLLVANHELFADPASTLHWMHLPDLKSIPWWIILSAHAAIGARHADGRLADRAHDGQPHHEAEAVLRLLRRDGRGGHRHRWPRSGASRSRRRTRSPERSSAWARRSAFSAVRWGVAGKIVYAWILTIPMAAAIGALSYGILSALTH